jgi:hypothetical protein
MDCSLHPENLHHNLPKGNAGNFDIPDDSRRNVRWFSMTQHFQPRQVISAGNMIDVNLLPAPSSQCVFIRAPRDGNGDLINAITKHMIDNYPQQILTITTQSTLTCFPQKNNVMLYPVTCICIKQTTRLPLLFCGIIVK